MEYHQPYHLALGDSLRMARQRFGCAILLDIHSMPPLTGQGGLTSAKIVLGDRFGRSASGRLTDAAAHIFAAWGLKVAQNHPYPELGGALVQLQPLMRITYAVLFLKRKHTRALSQSQ